jgi:hypothetical protein
MLGTRRHATQYSLQGVTMASTVINRADFKTKRTRVVAELPPALLSSLDGWRDNQEDKPTRAEAVEILLGKAISTEGAH